PPRCPSRRPYTTLFRSERGAACLLERRHLRVREVVAELVDDEEVLALRAAPLLAEAGSAGGDGQARGSPPRQLAQPVDGEVGDADRKSTRLNSSHGSSS